MCKIKVGKKSFMPLFSFLDKYCKDISKEELGSLVLDAYNASKKSSKTKEVIRAREGAELRAQREKLGISRREMSNWIGACEKCVANLEKGKPVQSSNIMIKAYKHGLEYIK